MEDLEWLTKKTFLEWIVHQNNGLSAFELLREFERQFVQLSGPKDNFRSRKDGVVDPSNGCKFARKVETSFRGS